MSKDSRLAYFKDNYQDPGDDEFDPTQYYYKRPERQNGELDFDVGALGAYDTTGLGLPTNPANAQFANRFSMSGLTTGAMGMNMPMYSPQTQLNNNLSSLSRVMMQPQNTSNPTTPRMRMTSPIRNGTPNSSMMMNQMEQQYRSQPDMIGLMNSNNEMYAPSQAMFSRTNDVRTQQQVLMQQHLQLEQQRVLSQQQTNAPTSTTSTDSKYGLLGLRNVIKMTDQDLNVLALGFDLTTLGLNLNSPEYLYSSFASPWNDRPSHIVPEYKIPSCYLRSPLPLKEWQIKKFTEDTLFYIFYSMPRDVLQVVAAKELTSREWLYHKEQKIWFTQVPNTELVMKTPTFEKGTYKYFDPNTWKQMTKENFVVEYDKVMQMNENQNVPTSMRGGMPKIPFGSGAVSGLAQQQ